MPSSSNEEIELELTYLAKHIPQEIKEVTPTKLRDIYLPEESDRPFIRLRQKGSQYEITKKRPINDNNMSVQAEQTIPLDEDEFNALARSSKREVEKDRYKVELNGHIAEVDVFGGVYKGLVLIDFEFTNIEDLNTFEIPDYCLADVTQEWFIAGGQLAGKTYTDIESDLARFDYVALSL